MAIQASVSITAPGGATDQDRLGATLAIEAHNNELPKDENGDPINPLPYADDAEKASSLEVLMNARVTEILASYSKQAAELMYNNPNRREAYENLSAADKAAVDGILANGGFTP